MILLYAIGYISLQQAINYTNISDRRIDTFSASLSKTILSEIKWELSQRGGNPHVGNLQLRKKLTLCFCIKEPGDILSKTILKLENFNSVFPFEIQNLRSYIVYKPHL